MKFTSIAATAAALLLTMPAAPAAAQDMSFDAYLQLLIARARAEGVSEATLQRMTADLSPNMRVIELDRDQPGTPTTSGYPPLAPYIARHVDRARISGG
ncbi:MAG: lytic murein transglycosylase, partial [Erythrobacter sp.]|nr:lytic murein transglycosylase [Erythrobacter sp.]